MKTSYWLLNEITTILGSAIWSFFVNALIFGFIGLIAGILFVRICNKRKVFNRSNKVWTFIAKINNLYIPILFSLLFGVYASVFSLQRTTNNWIKGSVNSIQEYATGYLPEVEKIAFQLNDGIDKTEKAIFDKVVQGAGFSKYSMGQTFYYSFNRSVISFMLSKYGFSDDVSGIIKMVNEKKITQLNSIFFDGITKTVQNEFINKFFNPIYFNLFWIFLPFILIPVIEFIVYIFYSKMNSEKIKM